MNKYRFKTEEEFKRDGLWNKNRPVEWVSVMNKYLGQDIPDKYNRFCDANKDFNYETWSFIPEDYVLKEESFVLPSKWCIKLTEENVKTLGDWRSSGPLKDKRYVEEGWYLHTPKHGAKGYNEYIRDPDYTEITFEQFKQHVLKESPVVETTKEIDMKDIQEEAKKRFPIGCKFIPVGDTQTYTLIEDDCTYEIRGEYIWAHDGHGHLYGDGKWATLVSLPETKKEMFYEGDYIVTLINDANCGKVNYCSKQSKDSDYLQPVIDTKGYPNNGNSKFLSTDTSNTKWRYATKEEAEAYERIKKPYDVTVLQKKEEALDFSKELKTSPVPKESDYPVMPVDAYPSINKETFIDNVQSVDVILRTKRKSFKF